MFASRRWLLLALLSLGISTSAFAGVDGPSATVRGFFSALERKDYNRALDLTSGEAQARTAKILGALEHEAAQHHAQIELKVKRLEMAVEDVSTVKVHFDIDVIGKKWLFRKLARTLSGSAQFHIGNQSRISAIEGDLH
jgi:hypothetical protein